jgi:hypothetical protein
MVKTSIWVCVVSGEGNKAILNNKKLDSSQQRNLKRRNDCSKYKQDVAD